MRTNGEQIQELVRVVRDVEAIRSNWTPSSDKYVYCLHIGPSLTVSVWMSNRGSEECVDFKITDMGSSYGLELIQSGIYPIQTIDEMGRILCGYLNSPEVTESGTVPLLS